MRIGKAAELAGVNVQTLRYYERTGLLPKASRRPSGYRQYDRDTVRLVHFIKHAQGCVFCSYGSVRCPSMQIDPTRKPSCTPTTQ